MSHFTVMVINTKGEDDVEQQLAPFNENLEVEGYEEECYCVSRNVGNNVREVLIKEKLDIGYLREEFNKKPEDEQRQENWTKWIQPHLQREKELQEQNPEWKTPDKECDECNGTGVYISTRNPESKWDWYSIGGRWKNFFKHKKNATHVKTGNISLVAPISDKEFYCDQLLKSEIDFEGMIADQEPECRERWEQYQEEKGKKEGWDKRMLEFMFGEITGFEEFEHYLQYVRSKPKLDMITPYAVVLDGKWIQKGEMGWWGISTNENDEWPQVFEKIFNQIPDKSLLTLVDCHI